MHIWQHHLQDKFNQAHPARDPFNAIETLLIFFLFDPLNLRVSESEKKTNDSIIA